MSQRKGQRASGEITKASHTFGFGSSRARQARMASSVSRAERALLSDIVKIGFVDGVVCKRSSEALMSGDCGWLLKTGMQGFAVGMGERNDWWWWKRVRLNCWKDSDCLVFYGQKEDGNEDAPVKLFSRV